jgi:sortase A
MVLRWSGRALIAIGSLLILFILYELYGTGFVTSHDQSRLRKQFNAQVHQAAASPTPSPTPSAVTATASPDVTAPTNPDAGAGVAEISIPKINIDMIVVEGVSVANLKEGPGHYPGTPLPGQAGNVVISGHRTTYLHPFRNLDQLHPGDPVYLTLANGKRYTYIVVTERTVLPTDIAVTDDTPDNRLTLTTCTPPFSASHRLILFAALQGSPSNATPASLNQGGSPAQASAVPN